MEFGIGSYLIAFGAGVLSTLSPCVLPLLPVIIACAVNENKFGPLVVAIGMALSFAVIGTMLASVGVSIGLNQNYFRYFAALVMVLIGVVLLSTSLQERFAMASSGLSNFGHQLISRVSIHGLRGQFMIGILLGLVWGPCVGPTLGAAVTLASQGRHLINVTLLMCVFGLGAGLPIALLSLLSREAMIRARVKLQGAGHCGKNILGMILLVVGIAIVSGLDKRAEEFLNNHAPAWLTALTTSL